MHNVSSFRWIPISVALLAFSFPIVSVQPAEAQSGGAAKGIASNLKGAGNTQPC